MPGEQNRVNKALLLNEHQRSAALDADKILRNAEKLSAERRQSRGILVLIIAVGWAFLTRTARLPGLETIRRLGLIEDYQLASCDHGNNASTDIDDDVPKEGRVEGQQL